MAVVIRLMRAGAKKRPFYRMVAADSRRQRDGRFLEILGHYNPLSQPFELVVHKDKVESWIGKGAQPSEQAASLLRSLGISVRSTPQAAPGTTVEPATPAAKKPAVKRAVKRTLSARKVEKRAHKAAMKKAGTVAPAKKKKAKKS